MISPSNLSLFLSTRRTSTISPIKAFLVLLGGIKISFVNSPGKYKNRGTAKTRPVGLNETLHSTKKGSLIL